MKNQLIRKAVLLITFAGMIGANALANILPINGITTGAVSDSYPNLFAPAGYTFAIWGLIYLALLFALGRLLFQKEPEFSVVSSWFIVSNLANTVWIFAWHYRMIALSLGLILVAMVSVLRIVFHLAPKENRLLGISARLPFEIYGGWLLVATVANVTTLLVDVGFDGFGISEVIWMIFILAIGWLIITLTIIRVRSFAIGFVFLWAYGGILSKHVSSGPGFASAYPSVIFTVAGLMVLMIMLLTIMWLRSKKVS